MTSACRVFPIPYIVLVGGTAMKMYYCWRCQRDMPFLDEPEWARIESSLQQGMLDIKQYRHSTGADIRTARNQVKPTAMRLFLEITGVDGMHADTIAHHRLRDWGPECSNCGYLLRTAKATYCANCFHTHDAAL